MKRSVAMCIAAAAALVMACNAGTVDDEGGLNVAGLDDGEGGLSEVRADGPFTVFANPYANGTANPAEGITGNARELIYSDWELTVVKLEVTGLPANRNFGAHAHKLACNDNKAGGHYQNIVPPPGYSANDPIFANPDNEVWLDFTTDDLGEGDAVAWVAWFFRPGEARAVVVHDMLTDREGRAGPKLACIDIAF